MACATEPQAAHSARVCSLSKKHVSRSIKLVILLLRACLYATPTTVNTAFYKDAVPYVFYGTFSAVQPVEQ